MKEERYNHSQKAGSVDEYSFFAIWGDNKKNCGRTN